MRAFIIVDLQNDFCPGGTLAVSEGDLIIPAINSCADKFSLVITTQDWHPRDHGSFASNHEGKKPFEMGKLSGRDQFLWPDHCVQNSEGAKFHPDLKVSGVNFVKGTNPLADSYSGFFDDDGTSTGLAEFLREKGVTHIFLCGLATDYCVKFTAMDSLKEGFETTILEDLCRGVDMQPGDARKALDDLHQLGARISDSNAV